MVLLADDIKIQYSDVEQRVADMEHASGAIDFTFVKNIANGNVLNLVEKINQLNEILEQQGEEYRRILRMNNDTVKTSLQNVQETDEQLSSSIKAR